MNIRGGISKYMADEEKKTGEDDKSADGDKSAEDGDESADGDKKVKKNKKNKITGKTIVLFIALPILLVLALTATAIILTSSENTQTDSEQNIKNITKLQFYELPEFTVNLKEQDKQKQKYLKITLELEFNENSNTTKKINDLLPKIIDVINVYARELRTNDLEGTAGSQLLKEAILKRINFLIEPQKIDAVLFKQILIQ